MNKIFDLLKSKNYEDKIEALDLVYQEETHIPFIGDILKLLEDDDALVKTSAIECIGDFEIDISNELIRDLLKDDNELVVNATVITIGLLKRDSFLSYLVSVEKDSLTYIYALFARYLLKEICLEQILKWGLQNESYLVRCSTANLSTSFIRDADVNLAIEIFEEYLLAETLVAVRSSIEFFLKEYK